MGHLACIYTDTSDSKRFRSADRQISILNAVHCIYVNALVNIHSSHYCVIVTMNKSPLIISNTVYHII